MNNSMNVYKKNPLWKGVCPTELIRNTYGDTGQHTERQTSKRQDTGLSYTGTRKFSNILNSLTSLKHEIDRIKYIKKIED